MHISLLIPSGLGVRIGVYLQSFLCVLNVLVRAIPDPDTHSLKSLDEIIQSGVVALCTVVALIIAAFIDAAKYHRLGIYHATIACYLCWMLLLSAVAPVGFALALHGWLRDRIKANTEEGNRLRNDEYHLRKRIVVWSAICWAAQVVLGVFGIWVYATVSKHPYDNSPAVPHCETTTVAWFMGAYYIIGVEGPWQRMSVAFHAVLIIPLLLPFLILYLNGVAGSLILRLTFYAANRYGISIRNPLPHMSRTWPSFGLGIALTLLCAMTERTVDANHVDAGDKPWGQGQVFPILMAGIPAYQLLQSLWKCVRPPHESSENGTGGSEGADIQLGSPQPASQPNDGAA